MIRLAHKDDVPAIVAIEERSFKQDRFSPRSLRHLVTRAHGVCFVSEKQGVIQGYILVLYNQATQLARLYSFAVDPKHRGQGIGLALMRAAEEDATKRGCLFMRLEVRATNKTAIRLYEKQGYRQFGLYEDYYSDHGDALRMEKPLVRHKLVGARRVPYYQQTLDFTCGPSALMMAMAALDKNYDMGRREELRLWREATTIFMMSGHGGCGPTGLALAAWRRGFACDLYATDMNEPFLESVRHKDKREVMRIVQRDFSEEIAKTKIKVHHRAAKPDELKAALDSRRLPLVLISTYRLHRQRFPHWLIVTGYDKEHFFVHDPWVNQKNHASRVECMNIPIPAAEFLRMSRYGKANLGAALIIGPKRAMKRKNQP